jgi:hypothetical protein
MTRCRWHRCPQYSDSRLPRNARWRRKLPPPLLDSIDLLASCSRAVLNVRCQAESRPFEASLEMSALSQSQPQCTIKIDTPPRQASHPLRSPPPLRRTLNSPQFSYSPKARYIRVGSLYRRFSASPAAARLLPMHMARRACVSSTNALRLAQQGRPGAGKKRAAVR